MSVPMSVSAQNLVVSGVAHPAVEVQPEMSTGLTALYVVDDASAATLSYTSSSGNITWQRFDARGGGFASDVEGLTRNGNTFSIPAGSEDSGYIIDDGSRRYCFWVNYANHGLELDALSVDEAGSECDRTMLTVTGKASAITYYTINGRPMELSRAMHLQYRTLEFSEDAWQQVERDVEVSSTGGHISIQAPLCNTDFRLSGDGFPGMGRAGGRGVAVIHHNCCKRRNNGNTGGTRRRQRGQHRQRGRPRWLGSGRDNVHGISHRCRNFQRVAVQPHRGFRGCP